MEASRREPLLTLADGRSTLHMPGGARETALVLQIMQSNKRAKQKTQVWRAVLGRTGRPPQTGSPR